MKTSSLLVAAILSSVALLAQAQPAATPSPAPKPVDTIPQVAAHAELITGSVTIGSGEATKRLSAGDEILERQTVVVGPNSYANLRFLDGGHVLLRPNSEFAIDSFHYSAPPVTATPAPGALLAAPPPPDSTAFFRLVRGGFRALSGLIGKIDHASYKVTTPAATIGIRGTDYEVAICTDDCPQQAHAAAGGGVEVASNDLTGLQLAQGGGGATEGGVIVATHEGSISLHTSRGDYTVDAGHVMLALLNGQTFMLPVIPDVMIQNPAPSPEGCK